MRKTFNYFNSTLLQYISILILGIVIPQPGNTTPGGCNASQAFPYISPQGQIHRDEPVWVIQHNAHVYDDNNSQIDKVKFGTKFFAKWRRNGLIQVQLGDRRDPLGWIDASALLCRNFPIREYGLERKVFIKANMRTVTAYPHPSRDSCAEGGCKELPRFDRYFIVDETMPGNIAQGRYLLSMAYNLSQLVHITQPLVGWVNKTSTIPWNTGLGLRPKTDVRIYSTLEQAWQHNPIQGIKIIGGAYWYTLSMRLPVLDRIYYKTQLFYKVAINYRRGEAYIPVSDQLEEEIEISQRQLDDWIQLLRPSNFSSGSPQQQRDAFVRKLGQQIQSYIGGPEIETTQSYQEYIQRSGFLPVRQNSPFLQYTLAEINAMEPCVFMQLKNWVTGHHNILTSISQNPANEPIFTEDLNNGGRSCFTTNPKDQRLPRLIYNRESRRLRPDNATYGTYQYAHRLHHGTTLYWLPTRFLP